MAVGTFERICKRTQYILLKTCCIAIITPTGRQLYRCRPHERILLQSSYTLCALRPQCTTPPQILPHNSRMWTQTCCRKCRHKCPVVLQAACCRNTHPAAQQGPRRNKGQSPSAKREACEDTEAVSRPSAFSGRLRRTLAWASTARTAAAVGTGLYRTPQCSLATSHAPGRQQRPCSPTVPDDRVHTLIPATHPMGGSTSGSSSMRGARNSGHRTRHTELTHPRMHHHCRSRSRSNSNSNSSRSVRPAHRPRHTMRCACDVAPTHPTPAPNPRGPRPNTRAAPPTCDATQAPTVAGVADAHTRGSMPVRVPAVAAAAVAARLRLHGCGCVCVCVWVGGCRSTSEATPLALSGGPTSRRPRYRPR